MSTTSVEDFLTELDVITAKDSPEKAGMAEQNRANTRSLLQVADQLFDTSPELQQMIANKSLQPNISGETFTREIFEGTEFRRPVIDLVQQGGTMLGIALLGYTYILERAGVRFRSMAGTSAGAINTLLLAALPEKIYQDSSPFSEKQRQAVKSEFLAHLVANKDFTIFLDRRGFVGRIQKWLVKRITFIDKIFPYFMIAMPFLLVGFSFLSYYLINANLFNRANGLQENEIRVFNFISGTLGILAVLLFLLLLLFRLFRNVMGVNPGEKVYEWMTSILETPYVGISTTEELLTRKKTESMVNNPEKLRDPRLVFIAANLTHNRIVKFPDNTTDYWKKEFAPLVAPAAYVRASMSLPFIFYAFIPQDRFVRGPVRYDDTVETLARFVDGGMLSNFPIREFHVPPSTLPNYPTFGVLLSPRTPGDNKDDATSRKRFFAEPVFKYIVSFISTFRNFYDSDFLFSNPEFLQLVESVDTRHFNSLDFAMDTKTKHELFAEGAKTAIRQLVKFNWSNYYQYRLELQKSTV
ncbi:MAG: patatin-like phospholipase family protein [Chitinophagaceae bacterium]